MDKLNLIILFPQLNIGHEIQDDLLDLNGIQLGKTTPGLLIDEIVDFEIEDDGLEVDVRLYHLLCDEFYAEDVFELGVLCCGVFAVVFLQDVFAVVREGLLVVQVKGYLFYF